MRDEADVGLVDAHAEGDRGDDDDAFLAQKALLVARARLGRQAGMVGQRLAAVRAEPGRGVLDRPPGQAIDDAGIARVLVVEKAQQILARVAAWRRPGRTGSGRS